ncbi:hypothetical protein DB346_21345 [Verrucomicrobia bacterium LW23]|nr:hypothetical protein DB346_21345 [Verrucomicrobia bacterium LW23]
MNATRLNIRDSISQCSRKAFSLIELMSVIALVSIMLSMSAPTLFSMLSGRSVSLGLNTVASMTAQARQTALSGGQPVALVISTADAANPNSTQGIILLAAVGQDGSGTMQWKAKCIWNRLPRNVLVEAFERSGGSSFFNNASTSAGGPLTGTLPVQMDNRPVESYVYIVFYPDGTVSSPTAGPAITIRQRGRQTAQPDFTLVVQSDSGRSKVIAN